MAIREELSKRSVSVRWVEGGGGSGIHLRTIMFQVLGEPQADLDNGDIERLFDAVTEREAPIQRLVLIVDDAERLLPDAIGYLRLLASVAMERMPQIIFIGDFSFWDIADQAAQAGFENLMVLSRPAPGCWSRVVSFPRIAAGRNDGEDCDGLCGL